MPNWVKLITGAFAKVDHAVRRPQAEDVAILERMLPNLQEQHADCTATYHKFVTDKQGSPALLFGILMEELLLLRVHQASPCRFALKGIIDGETGEIADIENDPRAANRGLGTELLLFAEEIFRQLGVIEVTGWLSPVDEGHRDRQVHFYGKNGYTVNLQGEEGQIHKRLLPAASGQTGEEKV